jgi:hypothetical protein
MFTQGIIIDWIRQQPEGDWEIALVDINPVILENVLLMQNPRFWKMIEARRVEPTLSLDEVRKRLEEPTRRRRRR